MIISPDTSSQSNPHATPDSGSQSEATPVDEIARIVEALDNDRTEREDTEPLDNVHQAIEHLSHLDPAEATGPGAAIADILSRALEEEDL